MQATAEYVVYFHEPVLVNECNPSREKREHHVFKSLLQMIPGLEQRLMETSEEEIGLIGDLVSYDCLSHPILITAQDPERFV
jgi:hypothetical protein